MGREGEPDAQFWTRCLPTPPVKQTTAKAMYTSIGAVLVGAVGALVLMALVNILSGRKPWDLSA